MRKRETEMDGKNAILFDLDGTLWDSTGSALDIWNLVLDRNPVPGVRMSPEMTRRLMGKTAEEAEQLLFPNLPKADRRRIMAEFEETEVAYLWEHGGILYTGVEETLCKLREAYDLYLVSNCQDGYVQAFLHAHHLENIFLDFEMSGRTGMEKGRNIRLLMERNRIDRAVYVGDTGHDEAASRFAGIAFVWASYGFGRADSPDGTIGSIRELPEAVKRLTV